MHGGILAIRDNAAHMKAIADHNISTIDLVVINLYPFRWGLGGGGGGLRVTKAG